MHTHTLVRAYNVRRRQLLSHRSVVGRATGQQTRSARSSKSEREEKVVGDGMVRRGLKTSIHGE